MMLLYNESLQPTGEGIEREDGSIYRTPEPAMSIDAAMLAIVPLMCQVLEYAEQALDAEITPEMVAKITLESYRAVAKRFGLDKQGEAGAPQPAPQAPQQAAGGLLGAQPIQGA